MCYRMLSVSVVTTRKKDLITVYVVKKLNICYLHSKRDIKNQHMNFKNGDNQKLSGINSCWISAQDKTHP